MNRVKLLQTVSVVFLVVCVVSFPKDMFDAAKSALAAWWDIVFPALLPFFIGSQLLLATGLVHFMGVLLEPVMRPLFNLPGCASFVMAIGYTSGFPISAMITAQLREDGLCTRSEGERLLAFTNNASPLFMLGAVAVGMYNSPRLGVIIVAAHYLANLTVGFFLRFTGRDEKSNVNLCTASMNRELFRRALLTMEQKQATEKRPFGKILKDVVTTSVDTVCLIAGFMVLFAIIIRLFNLLGLMKLTIATLRYLLQPFGFTREALAAVMPGFFEITLGAQAISNANLPLTLQMSLTALILAWGGLSVHAQVAGVTGHTDIRMGIFTVARIAQGVLAVIYTIIFMGPLNHLFLGATQPVMSPPGAIPHLPSFSTTLFYSTSLFLGLTVLGLAALALLLIKQGASFISWRFKSTKRW